MSASINTRSRRSSFTSSLHLAPGRASSHPVREPGLGHGVRALSIRIPAGCLTDRASGEGALHFFNFLIGWFSSELTRRRFSGPLNYDAMVAPFEGPAMTSQFAASELDGKHAGGERVGDNPSCFIPLHFREPVPAVPRSISRVVLRPS